ncbi:MAG: bifunctional proline dehydrogenase/L-glutamate gamma-semialdehyde dehydrogenase PutA [Granulosicoccaceae bacterium]
MRSIDLSLDRSRLQAPLSADEAETLRYLLDAYPISEETRTRVDRRAIALVEGIRSQASPGMMEVFLAEYGLSTSEGVALMCLAEALLRVPDTETIDELIEDKIAPSEWGAHLGRSSSSLVNASTWALLLTGTVLNDDGDGVVGVLRGAVKRLGEPVIRTAVARAMRELGAQFVLGRDIAEAISNAKTHEARGYSYSYDMLGEGARTEADAQRYHLAYSKAIVALAEACTSDDIRENPGISVKLSALHPRYEVGQRQRVLEELVPRARSLALLAKSAGMGFNIDAEEADRLDLSLEVIELLVSDPSLRDWDGLGVVVQAYGRRASYVIDWLYALSGKLGQRVMVRLVKGAYWDTEIKRAQVEGLAYYPVFTRKASTDVSYLCCAQKLLDMRDRIYPQFATHNAHTVAAILEMAGDDDNFEFQRLHGMGEALHQQVLDKHKTRCRIYAPVGAHRDLLAYLVRRLLENGANSSFVSQIVDEAVPAAEVVADPVAAVHAYLVQARNPAIALPLEMFGSERKNSRGWDLHDAADLGVYDTARHRWRNHRWTGGPLTVSNAVANGVTLNVVNPCDNSDVVGVMTLATAEGAQAAIEQAQPWSESVRRRAQVLQGAADLYEQCTGELVALLQREAGKTNDDAVAELREAVDFLRYYAVDACKREGAHPRGVMTCISPWNFPLAIFSGQIAAALATGNAVLAKPAEQTSLVGGRAVELLHQAGVPVSALQYLPGPGAVVGAALTSHPKVKGVCFTGSTATAQRIAVSMAEHLTPEARLIAETGGLNAMIVDSTALHEQAVRDIVDSAFRSAGQRCSALRVLYVQEEVADDLQRMLFGAMDELVLGDPWTHSTDVGPMIDEAARAKVAEYVTVAEREGRLLKQLERPEHGHFLPPTVLRVGGIEELVEHGEVFAPVLHIATFKATELDQVIDDINSADFGLTFGLHSRIDDRVQRCVERLKVGNIYINRNQIGAVVGVQPFGGEGLSGTGPKAGGPMYLDGFIRGEYPALPEQRASTQSIEWVQQALDALDVSEAALRVEEMPGPTGESNRLSSVARGKVLCLGPGRDAALEQKRAAEAQGCAVVAVAAGLTEAEGLDGVLEASSLSQLQGIDVVVCWQEGDYPRACKQALANRPGNVVPLVVERELSSWCVRERHVCIDTTAAGGNASLLAGDS